MFEPPPETAYNVLSLGAGVQSSCLAFMAAKGEITPMPDFAVFADTGAEPQSVYDWLEYIQCKLPYPVYVVEKGNLTQDALERHTKVKGKDVGQEYVKNLIPAFGLLPDGTKTAAIGRKCTADYKIQPILAEIKKRCQIPRMEQSIRVTQWIGISYDEMQRAKGSPRKWMQNRFPLLERKMRRHDCHQWMKDNGYPEPPRSACYYCPFHSDAEWRRLRNEEPHEFRKAVAFDQLLRFTHRDYNPKLRMKVYLHNSCKPLGEIDFDNDEDKGQQVWDFQAECEGMCGI